MPNDKADARIASRDYFAIFLVVVAGPLFCVSWRSQNLDLSLVSGGFAVAAVATLFVGRR